jgi:beta-lactamase superfamily II metal-dependent hydrolase
MKKRKVVPLIFFVSLFWIMAGCAGIESDEDTVVQTFSEWTENEMFQEIPAMMADNVRIGELSDIGGNHYAFDVDGADVSDYWAYLDILEEAGFVKYVDNGEAGLDGSVYSASFTKDKLTLTVTHLENVHKTYISVGQEQPLSERLLYDESYIADNQPDAKTTVTMLETFDWGNSFVIQLKNGHFILNDGGMEQDLVYLIEYMESLVPAGEKPVIEGWFISHAHIDHSGCLMHMTNYDYIDRMSVEGFYFNEPNSEVSDLTNASMDTQSLKMACSLFKTSQGEKTKFYRPSTGQRYYFSDVTVDVLFTQEQFPLEDTVNPDLNDASTWLLYTIDGQTFMLPGDANVQPARRVLEIYGEEFFDFDIATVFHHGHNTTYFLAEKFRCKTVLYTFGKTKNDKWGTEIAEGNALLQSIVDEYLSYGDGTKRLTFPYKVGSYESLPLQQWLHHPARDPALLNQPDRLSDY